jgi:hypothetical protein
MKGGRSACRVELTEPAHGLAGGQGLHGHAALLELPDRAGVGPQAAVGAGAHDEVAGELVQLAGWAAPGRSPRPMSWSAACWIPRRSLRVAASSSPALATA